MIWDKRLSVSLDEALLLIGYLFTYPVYWVESLHMTYHMMIIIGLMVQINRLYPLFYLYSKVNPLVCSCVHLI